MISFLATSSSLCLCTLFVRKYLIPKINANDVYKLFIQRYSKHLVKLIFDFVKFARNLWYQLGWSTWKVALKLFKGRPLKVPVRFWIKNHLFEFSKKFYNELYAHPENALNALLKFQKRFIKRKLIIKTIWNHKFCHKLYQTEKVLWFPP